MLTNGKRALLLLNISIFVVVILMLFNSKYVSAFAEKSIEEDYYGNAFINAVVKQNLRENSRIRNNPIIIAYGEKNKDYWRELIQHNYLVVNDKGICIDMARISNIELETYAHSIMDKLPSWNSALKEGSIIWDKVKKEFYSPVFDFQYVQSLCKSSKSSKLNDTYMNNIYLWKGDCGNSSHSLKGFVCDCNYIRKNATLTATQNYNHIDNYYNDMLILSATSPNISPWGATVGHWISLVEPNGAWDYKVFWLSNPYCFSIHGLGGYHFTSEWFGNYNYGFTGKRLFSLTVLHAGSFAVSGFNPSDVTTDWPAIDLGYSHAP